MKSHNSRKAELAFEYMTQLTIIVVVLLVVVGMIITFRGQILQMWNDISNPDAEPPVNTNAFFVEKILPAKYSASEFASYVEACWADTREAEESRVCYVLKGQAEVGVTALAIKSDPPLDPVIAPHVVITANFGKDLFSINYEAIADEIHIKS